MKSELPLQKNCPVYPTSQIFWIFKLGKMTFGLGQTNNVLQTAICQVNKKANILTTGLRIKDILRIIILMYSKSITQLICIF